MAKDKESTAFDDVIEKETETTDTPEADETTEADSQEQSDTSSESTTSTDTTTPDDASEDEDTSSPPDADSQSEDTTQSDGDTTPDSSPQSRDASTESTQPQSNDEAAGSDVTSTGTTTSGDADGVSADNTDPQRGTDADSRLPVSDSEPEFPYADADQHPLYMRSDAWNALHDVKFHTEATLLKKYGIRNVETRELDEAIARFIAETVDTEVLAEKVIEIRGYDPETLNE